MKRPKGLVLAMTALIVWFAFCLFAQAPRFERSLLSRSVETLAAADLTGVQVVFDGRDAALSGTVASTDLRVRAERLVASVEGVRTIDNRLRVAPAVEPEEPEPVPPDLVIRSRPDSVTLRGTVPSDARRAQLVGRARELFGSERVDARLAVDPRAQDGAALVAAIRVLEELARSRLPLEARLEGDSLRLSGTVDSRETRRRIEEQTREAAPGIRLFFSTVEVTASGETGESGEGRD